MAMAHGYEDNLNILKLGIIILGIEFLWWTFHGIARGTTNVIWNENVPWIILY